MCQAAIRVCVQLRLESTGHGVQAEAKKASQQLVSKHGVLSADTVLLSLYKGTHMYLL